LKGSIAEIVGNLKSVDDFSEMVVKLAQEVARQFCKRFLEMVDEYLFRTRDKRLKVAHIRSRWISFPFGDVRIKRRRYEDASGKGHYLLDALLGLKGKSPLTGEIKETGVYLATLLPFFKSAQVMEKSLPGVALSHTTINRLVHRIAECHQQAEKGRKDYLYETGAAPDSQEKAVPLLFVEADGVNIALQREKARKAEVKVGIAYEGWEEVSKERYRTKEKTIYCGITSGENFWEYFSLKLAARYDLSGVGRIILGGDGAAWVKGGVDLLGGTYQLDRFHLLRALHQALGHQKEMISLVYQACNEGDLPAALDLLNRARMRASGAEKHAIEQVIRYFTNNAAGLKDYRLALGEQGRFLRRTGAIESNVDKLAANRLKKKGMSWTIKGARAMACILMLSAEGKLSDVCKAKLPCAKALPPLKKMRRSLVKEVKNIEEKWLQATIPAIQGPHSNRPWVRYLKELSEVSLNV